MIHSASAQMSLDPRRLTLLQCTRLSLYVTVAALPLYTVRWQYGPVPTTLLETAIAITVALYLFTRWRDGTRRLVPTPYDVPILVLLLAGAISVLVANDHRAALGLYRAYFVEPIAIFYVAADLIRRKEEVQRLVLGFAVGSSSFAVLNLAVFYQALMAHSVQVGAAPSALYGDANYVAMYMEPPFALAAGILFLAPRPTWKLVGAIWLALTGAALALTFSKGGYLAVAALAAVAIVTIPRWRAAIALAVVAGFLVATQVPLLLARLATVASSLDGRSQIFSAALDTIRQHPLFGLGLGGYSYVFRGARPEIYPHDLWLTFWVEIGVLGVVAFAIVFIGVFWRGWKAWPATEGYWRATLWGLLGALTLWLVHGLVDSPYWKNDLSVEFWILAALQVAVVRATRRADADGASRLSEVHSAVALLK